MIKKSKLIVSIILVACLIFLCILLSVFISRKNSSNPSFLSENSSYKKNLSVYEELFASNINSSANLGLFYELYSIDESVFKNVERFIFLSGTSDDLSSLKQKESVESGLMIDYMNYDTIYNAIVGVDILNKISKSDDLSDGIDNFSALKYLAHAKNYVSDRELSKEEYLKMFSNNPGYDSDFFNKLDLLSSNPDFSIYMAASFLDISKDILLPFYTPPTEENEPFIRMTLPELAVFLKNDVIDNPDYAEYMTDELKADILRFTKFADKDLLKEKMDADELSELLEVDRDEIYAVLLLKNPFGAKKSDLPSFVDFVIDNVGGSSLLSSYIDDNTMYLLKLLRTIINYTQSDYKLDYKETAELFGLDPELTSKLYFYKEYPNGPGSGTDYASSQSINDIVNELTQRPENYGITGEELARLLKIKDVMSLCRKDTLSPKELVQLFAADLGISTETEIYDRLLSYEDPADPEGKFNTDVKTLLSFTPATDDDEEIHKAVTEYFNELLGLFHKDDKYLMLSGFITASGKKEADALLDDYEKLIKENDYDVQLLSKSLLRKELREKYETPVRITLVLVIVVSVLLVVSLCITFLPLVKKSDSK